MKKKEDTSSNARFTSTASEIGKAKYSSSAIKARTELNSILNTKTVPKTPKKK